MRLQIRDVRTPAEFPTAVRVGVESGAQALLTTAESLFVEHRARIVELASQHRLPAIYSARIYVDAGGFMSYGAKIRGPGGLYRRAAGVIDKIIKGAQPSDLPVEQPTEFELAINLKTAKSLGLVVPGSLLLRADQIIQ